MKQVNEAQNFSKDNNSPSKVNLVSNVSKTFPIKAAQDIQLKIGMLKQMEISSFEIFIRYANLLVKALSFTVTFSMFQLYNFPVHLGRKKKMNIQAKNE